MDSRIVEEIRGTVRPLLLQVLRLAEERNLETLRLEQDGTTLHIRRRAGRASTVSPALEVPPSAGEVVGSHQEDLQEARMLPVRSTLVGIFRSSSAGKAVPLGTQVEAGQVVAWIESMRLMYEVKAPRSGRLAEILVDDGSAVEYGQPLVVLETA